MAQQSSRLNRLLTLLDTGSSQATRFTAAKQIGDIAKSHPSELSSLLKKVSPLLRSKNWDTRVAAAHAIGAIVQNVKHTSLVEMFDCVQRKLSDVGGTGVAEDLVTSRNFQSNIISYGSFRSFDINKVLEFGALLASGGQEFDIATDNSKNPKDRLARQKQNLRRRLGLDVCEQFMDVNDMIKDEDLVLQRFPTQGNGVEHRYYMPPSVHNIQKLVRTIVPSAVSRRPSARELNLLKRKAKVNWKDQAKGWSEDSDADVSLSQSTTPKGSTQDSLVTSKLESDDDGFEHDRDGRWPFHTFVEQLILDMFDPIWEVRHGSVMALREILSHHGGSAGVLIPELSVDGAFDELIDIDHQSAAKQEREIDLNMQVPTDDRQPLCKKLKVEDMDSLPMNNVISSGYHHDVDIRVKVEDPGRVVSEGKVNGEFHVDPESVKVEPYSYFPNSSTEAVNSVDPMSDPKNEPSVPKAEMLANPGSNELMNLVKLARYSWMKNNEFLQDCAIRFLCVLSLDRFGDYVSDQVVAPVRETCAQALGATFKYMDRSLVLETLTILLHMQRRPEWEIRHGSLLGIKYLVAVRQDMLPELLGHILPACKAGLEDPDDDVRAVAADALIPAASAVVSLKGQTLHSIVMLLWDILLDLDDLSPSTSSVMNLLAEIYSQEEMIPKMMSKPKEELDLNEIVHIDDVGEKSDLAESPYMLSTLAPRLWPFMRHSITSVRYSAIRTLERLLEAGCKQSVSDPYGSSIWPSFILGDTLRIVFQNLLLESNDAILHCSERVWRLLVQCSVEDLEAVANAYMSSWIELSTTPFGSPLDSSKMFWPVALPRKSHFKAAAKMRAAGLEHESLRTLGLSSVNEPIQIQDRNGDASASTVKIIVGADVDISVTNTRVITASALGIIASKLRENSVRLVIESLWAALSSLSGVQRQVAAMVLISWFKEMQSQDLVKSQGVMAIFPTHIKSWLLDLLSCPDPTFPTKDSMLPYSELSRTYLKMRNEASQLLLAIESLGMLDDTSLAVREHLEGLSADEAIKFASKLSPSGTGETGNEHSGQNMVDDIELTKQRLLSTSGYLKCVQSNLHVTVAALVAAAVVWMSELPVRLNPIILPLMASIKREQEEILQQMSADALAELISRCISRKPSPNDKLIKNICSLTCMDPCETPQAGVIGSMDIIDDQDFLTFVNSGGKQKSRVHMFTGGEDRSKVEGFITRRGSELALRHLCQNFGASLFDKLPKIWDCLTEVLIPGDIEHESQIAKPIDSIVDPQVLINNIQVVRSISPLLDDGLKPKLLTLLPCIFQCICHSHVAVRLAASRCITSMAKSMTTNIMNAVIENAVPMLGDMASVYSRQGAGMLISSLVQGLNVELVPYAPLLVVPLLRCMSDCDQSVRQSVTRSFAALVPLLPLARGVPPPSGLGEGFPRNVEDAQFLEQLLDNSHIEDYKLSTELKVTLRRYQQEGINWLAFLKRFKLHGILCDDMGLGKTLQASAIVASDIAERCIGKNGKDIQPSLIVCPSTLVGHWAFEIEKYIDAALISTLQYAGSAQERMSLRELFDKHNVVITSYDVVRKDIEYLGQFLWHYCILDEGHVIKNAKSKITAAVKNLKAQHRLILSGTPIQNNIMDLWSLFDFLMPGFLGTDRQFQATYGKPLLAARDAKCSAKDAEAGALAMEALHKQVMPFLLRRTKDEVLSDLPEKIIQDRYCDLSPIQLKLYERFSESPARKEISSIVTTQESADTEGTAASPKASSHVFQAIQYLLKLCSHPLLVLADKTPESLASLSEFFPTNSDVNMELHKLHHSSKLVALQEILEECGIGIDTSSFDNVGSVGQHRVLIFAQHKALLDIIERDLFHAHMKSVTYLRLDGSVESGKRFDIVRAFNSDPTIDVLLLTTHVGGLGLNLTSADTLVFMEHDWNPMRDLQAMDRAHRLGQKKVVNVHRLIMRGTLEEKVMSLQRFKVSVANAVINSENASMKTMNTDQLLDLFASAESSTKGTSAARRGDGKFDGDPKLMGTGKGVKAILGGLEELWDQSQYNEEYNLSQFLSKLNG
ncbi:TATA-binding protein-associated factor BTAF1 [Linum perenne]